MASKTPGGSVRYFSGDNEDARENRRWKQWAVNKMIITMDKLGEAARGPYIYTLLSGKALEAVEHVKPCQAWGISSQRWWRYPLATSWCQTPSTSCIRWAEWDHGWSLWPQGQGRQTDEEMDCQRPRCLIAAPEKLECNFQRKQGIMLNRAGPSDEQRAVVISRARGDLKRESIAIPAPAILISLFPVEKVLPWWKMRP